MIYAQHDYVPIPSSEGANAEFWERHWEGRVGIETDLSDHAAFATVREILARPGLALEAGCGTGQWVRWFDRLGHTTIGIDFAETGLRVARRADPSLRLGRADFTRLPFESATFDYVYSDGAVEHDVRGPDRALREFHRVLKPTGTLMCSVPCLNSMRCAAYPLLVMRDWLKRRALLRALWRKVEPFEFYQYVYSPGAYRRILERCGFRVLELRPYLEMPRPAWMSRVARRIRRFVPFFDMHMMMAICRRADAQRPARMRTPDPHDCSNQPAECVG